MASVFVAIITLCLVCFCHTVIAAPNATNFESSGLSWDPRLNPSVGNGYLATTVCSDTVYVSGIFNGRGTKTPSHRARIPSTAAIIVRSNLTSNATQELFRLNVEQGVFYHRLVVQNFTLEQKIYAHRVHQHLLVTEISLQNNMRDTVSLFLTNVFGPPSADIEFQRDDFPCKSQNEFKINAMSGYIRITEEPDSSREGVAVVWRDIPPRMLIKPSASTQTFYFITAIATSLDAKDFVTSAREAYTAAMEKPEELLESHVQAWREIWSAGRIEVEGNLTLAQTISGSLYYTLSSLRPSWIFGLSPGGLATDGYDGHVFWDQETWMFPPLVLLHQDFARTCLAYRFARLQAAEDKAKKYGFKGAMFPWESALTGSEVCPGEIYADYEHHIIGDIAFAIKQLWMASGDQQWLEHQAFPVIRATAEFWASRAVYNDSKKAYVIYDVMPPDEDAEVVNNSAYTNTIAKMNLEFAYQVLPNASESWNTIAQNMFIPFDSTNNYHPEYEGYNGIEVKQADVILLGFPLMVNMSLDVRRNDLSFYEPRTNPRGPAMTKSMFAVNWLDVGDYARAVTSFSESYVNAKEPFMVWTEGADGGGAVNFITGAGGFLQSVLFGYGGLRLLDDKHLQFKPMLLPGSTQVKFVGIDYHGNSIDFVIGSSQSQITVASRAQSAPVLLALLVSSQSKFRLDIGRTVEVPNELVIIQPLQSDHVNW